MLTLVAVTVLSVWVVPPVLRGQIEQRAAVALGRPVTVGEVAFNPLQLAITIEELRVTERDGAAWLGWESLRINLQAWALVRGMIGFDAIDLDGFELRVARDAAGQLNFADLLEQETTGAVGEKREPFAILIDALNVRNARISFVDASHGGEPFVMALGPVSFSLAGFHTVGDPDAPYDFVATTEAGETLSWRGTLSATPLRSQGVIELGGIQLAKYAPYYRPFTGVEVRDGRVHLVVDYGVSLTGAGLGLTLQNGTIRLDDLALGAPGAAEPLIVAPQLEASGFDLDWAQQTVAVDALSWTGGSVQLVQNEAGLSLVDLLMPAPRESASPAVASTSPGWQVKIAATELKSVAVQWRDERLSTPAEINFDSFSATLKEVDSGRLDRMVQVGLDVNLANGMGALHATGEVSLVPFRPALDVKVEDLALATGNAYLRAATGYDLRDGRLSVGGALGSANGALVFRGNGAVSATTVLSEAGASLAQWESLSADGVSWVAEPLTVEVDQVRWVRPDVVVQIDPQGQLNWASSRPAAAPVEIVAAAPLPTPPGRPVMRVNRVELVQAQLDFADASLVRPAATRITDLSGELTGLSSVEMAKGRASLRGKANGSGSLVIEGDFNPLGQPAYTDLRIDFDRIDLSPLDGYVSHYAGYALQRGRLTLDIDFKLQDRRISSESVATLDGFTLGSKVISPDATTLPLPLALKLLRDAKGQIVLDIPVAGELDDPEFRIGRVVWRVIGNLLTKAATAPFGLLGSLVGGSASEDLAEQSFAAAQSELNEAAIQKLDTLAAALTDRPDLTLGIRGEYEPESDAKAWRPQIVENQLRTRATPAEWTEASGWIGKARTGHLVNLYLEVFGEAPIDVARSVAPPESVGPTEVQPESEPPEQAAGEADETLVGWIRRVLGGGKREAVAVSPDTPAPASAVVPASDPVLPALVLLPDEEIARRLIEVVQIGEPELLRLAEARARAVRDHLIAAGIVATRLEVEQPATGASRVALELR